MFTVHNKQGELQVGNRPINDSTTTVFNLSDGKYYRWTPTTVDGTVTGYWEETDGPGAIYNPVDGKYYVWSLSVGDDGVLTGYWNEVT